MFWAFVAQRTCARVTRALGTKTSVFTHFVSISRIMLYFVYLNICFHWLSFTLKPLSINISRSSSIKNQGPLRTKIIFKYFQGLEIGLLKFKGFQGFSRCVRTLLLGLV